MVSSSNNNLARRFAQRAAEHLSRKYGYQEARERLLIRSEAATHSDRKMLADIIDALDERFRPE